MNLRRLIFPGVFVALAAGTALATDPLTTEVSPGALLERLDDGTKAPYVLDVRTAEEYVGGHVPGAVNIPHDQVAARLAEVPKDREVVLYCRSGRRAQLAAEVLAENGYARLQHLQGDMTAWAEQGRPVEKPRDPEACKAALTSGGPTAQACASN
jgi:rhodanese-related sulfurtransferase